MCMICVKPKGIEFPPEEHLLNSENRNKDGIGIAYTKYIKNKKGTTVVIKKDFKDAKDCYAWMKKNLKVEQSIIIHQRLGTSGLSDEGTRHPFPVTTECEIMREANQKCPIAFAHNGIFSGHGSDKKYSDSMLVLSKFFGTLGNLIFNNESVRELVLEFVGNFNKIVFLKASGKVAIFGSGWIEHPNGCLYSNENYSYTVVKKKAYTPTNTWDSRSTSKPQYNNQQGCLPYYGKPPSGQPKKKYHCDMCQQGKKSKWRGDLEMYVCSKCYKSIHNEATKDVPMLSSSTLMCHYCGSNHGVWRFEIKENSCSKCFRNQLWFKNKLNELEAGIIDTTGKVINGRK